MILSAHSDLRVRRGQVITAAHHNGLVDFAERIQLQRGALKGRSEPGGFTPRITAQVVVRVEHSFRVLLAEEGEKLFAVIDPGYVNGIMPKIGGVALDDVDKDTELPPRLEVTKEAWKPYGLGERALVLLRYDLTADLLVSQVTPVALPSPPSAALPRQWHKLCAMLYRQDGTVRVRQRIFFDQYFTATGGTSAGRFNAWPRAAG